MESFISNLIDWAIDSKTQLLQVALWKENKWCLLCSRSWNIDQNCDIICKKSWHLTENIFWNISTNFETTNCEFSYCTLKSIRFVLIKRLMSFFLQKNGPINIGCHVYKIIIYHICNTYYVCTALCQIPPRLSFIVTKVIIHKSRGGVEQDTIEYVSLPI